MVETRTSGRQFHAMIRPDGPVTADWEVRTPNLEELLLAYLRSPDAPSLYTQGARVDAEGTQAA